MASIIDMEHEECERCGKLIPLDGGYEWHNLIICDTCLDDLRIKD